VQSRLISRAEQRSNDSYGTFNYEALPQRASRPQRSVTLNLELRGYEPGEIGQFQQILLNYIQQNCSPTIINLALINTSSEPCASHNALNRGNDDHTQTQRGPVGITVITESGE